MSLIRVFNNIITCSLWIFYTSKARSETGHEKRAAGAFSGPGEFVEKLEMRANFV